MRIIVLGAGVIGTTTAYYLAKAGHKVEVFERQQGVADETSFANAGQLSFGYSSPWAAPGIPLKGIKWLLQRHSPFALKLTFHPEQYFWMLRLLANCRHKPYLINKERMLRVAEYSRHCLDQLRAETGIQYEGRQLGTTQLLRTTKQLNAVEDDIRVLEQMQVPFKRLTAQELLEVEPALVHSSVALAGGLNFPHDQTGDCHLFTQYLAKLAKKEGVKFNFGVNIEKLVVKNDRIAGVYIDGVLHLADQYVLALGSYSAGLLRSADLRIPVYPFKGYSLTAKIQDEARAPRSTVLDESYKIAITRFDERIRVGGMAEIVGHDLSLKPSRKQTLEMVAQQLYPDAGNYHDAEFWCGLRPATPDSTPIVGATPYANLWTNTGHGTLGWTMACGSGRYLADLISGNRPEISGEGLDMSRYSR